MKKALYLEDSYLKEFDAEVKEANGKYIVLDKTAFYPNSGGQLFDTGTITKDNKEYNVVYVGKFNGQISHEVDKEGLKKGDKVRCKINWQRRYKLMRSHTSAHIISQIIHKETSALITGNQLKLEKSRVDFSLEKYNPDNMQKYIDMANEIVDKDLKVSTEYISREEAENKPELSKLAKGLPKGIKEIRLVKIGNFDIQADGGTHVKSTKEIGKIKLIKCKNKGKNNRRLYFKIE
jgi:misacylated tRNA(Ala) deacylase